MRILTVAVCLLVAGCGGSGGNGGNGVSSSVPQSSEVSSQQSQSSLSSASSESSQMASSDASVSSSTSSSSLQSSESSRSSVSTSASSVFSSSQASSDQPQSSSSSSSFSSAETSSSTSSEPVAGLSARPSNTSCLAGESPQPEYGVELQRVYGDLSFSQPVDMRLPPDDSTSWYLAEQSGRILRFANQPNVDQASVFADLRNQVNNSANEAGLLSFAFHPQFASNGEVYVFYQTDEPGGGCCDSLLSRFSTDGSGSLDLASEQVLIRFTAPYRSKNHFGGRVGFGDDGYLYLSIGDGGSAGDPDNRAQNTANLWGSMIRIDVNGGSPYAIPNSNPFADQSGFLCNTDTQMLQKASAGGDCPEVYAWGLRNPWRWSFDRATGELWLADVGQGNWEEINKIQRGGNYGWRLREGAHCYNPANNCDTGGLIDPVAEEPQPDFQSITGGFRYRGSAIASLQGKYVYGDFVTGPLHALKANDAGGWDQEVLMANTGQNIASFAEDHNGELYMLSFSGGIFQLVESDQSAGVINAPAAQLSDTGCVDAANPRLPAPGLIPYSVNAPFWSDGAQKKRWMALPDNKNLNVSANQDWTVPPGSVLVKNFYLSDQLIETRLLKHHTDGVWAGYTYAWNEAGTDAGLVEGGAVRQRQGQDWIYPSGSDCMQCHTEAAGRALGLETVQLNSNVLYPSSGIEGHQVTTLKSIGALSGSTTDAKLADPADQNALLQDRARAYLHTNCAQCHQPGGGTNVDMDLRWHTSFADMQLCNRPPQNGDMGLSDATLLKPGDSDSSILVSRMALRDHAQQMPPVGSNQIDTQGKILLSAWIDSLSRCTD
ncbi:PQQ-dependent sugar dehydrogenase [Gilvimarinus xylanilyticus]|uniref:PQQ-dependent sugar dehydrogenase n=1 Tax=Gilvimarinus xylanilyticus TaxID=2944139 RepID=A0A9X2I3U8_9GAMM|nr:PQQ-dependent sugar dehydrogenase [Gilvimarinus xylanilyticus]MCP8898457.1 PQQ-dependent sugar dehydrogenase [Gilvimarinus xylanilyticus]